MLFRGVVYIVGVKVHPYFLRRMKAPDRQGITPGICERIVSEPDYRDLDPRNGRWRYWGFAPEVGQSGKWIRVIVLPDGETLFNAHPDRGYARKKKGSEK